MNQLRTAFLLLGLTTVVSAQAPTLAISIGLRETGANGDTFNGIGGTGSTSGAIEWVNLDAQMIPVDGTWQQLTFDLANDPITGFTGDGVLDGTFGVFEHIRVLNSGGVIEPISIWVDDFNNTTTTMSATWADYGMPFTHGDEVMFQEAGFSGSTSGNVNGANDTTGADNFVGSRSESERFDFQFVDGNPTRWCRFTTFGGRSIPNPQVRFDNSSVITFWIRAGIAQENLRGEGPGNSVAEIVGTGLNAGEMSTYYVGAAPANSPGVIFFSLPGQPDLPLLGGTLVSGTGNFAFATFFTDTNGQFNVMVPGFPVVADAVVQSGLLNPVTVTAEFTNALQARWGQ